MVIILNMLDKRKFYINGEWVSPSKNSDFNVINPATEEPYVTISLGNEGDTNKAVVAAKNAFTSWKNTSVEERITLLEKLLNDKDGFVRDLIEEMNPFSGKQKTINDELSENMKQTREKFKKQSVFFSGDDMKGKVQFS